MSSPNRTIDICSKHPNFSAEAFWIKKILGKLDALEEFKIPHGDLSIVFLTNDQIEKLHEAYLDDPTSTDVITFPGDPEMDFAGEICVCVDVAKERASEFQSTFEDELKLYLIHGWLHLAGYQDDTEENILLMRRAEKIVLEALRA